MKKTVFSIFLFFIGYLNAQIHIRYNQIGYQKDERLYFIVMSEKDISKEKYSISTHNNIVLETAELGKSISGVSAHTPFGFNYEIILNTNWKIGEYKLTAGGQNIQFKIQDQPYSFLTSEILRQFRVQRSGSKEAINHGMSHKGDKRCLIFRRKTKENNSWEALDTLPQYVDMLGGWYDAGDYIKFTLTTAYSSYLMLLAYEYNPNLFKYIKYSKTTNYDIVDEAIWGLDWLMKTYPNEREFIIQVAGHKDHQQGKRMPEFDEQNGHREAYSGFSPTQMGYTAAALALGSRLLKEYDPAKCAKYLEQAKKIYARAKNESDCFWVKHGWEEFYADKSYHDNLLLAATELFNATQNIEYQHDMKALDQKTGQGYWASWGNAHLLAHLRAGISNEDEKDFAFFRKIAESEGNIWKIPHEYTWSSLYSFFSVANSSLIKKLKDSTHKELFEPLTHYTLGMNNWGKAFICSDSISNGACNIYSQIYQLNPGIKPIGAIAEGPGDRMTHEKLKQYFGIPNSYELEKFNSEDAVFYDLNTDFQTMETTIGGLADGLLFFSLLDKYYQKK